MIWKIAIRFILSAFALLALAGFAEAFDDSIVPDRRKPQFQTDFGYAVFPYPYSLPGIGTGISLIGAAMNIADTYTDAYGILFAGDVRGAALGVGDIHIIPRTLILEAGFGTLSRVTIQSYGQRGMNTDKNDYRLIELGDTEYYGESGSVADLRSELGKIWRDSYGVGLRVVTASGVVLRGDLAFGQEGANTAIFIGYPWEI